VLPLVDPIKESTRAPDNAFARNTVGLEFSGEQDCDLLSAYAV
jgi:hypothetical protein